MPTHPLRTWSLRGRALSFDAMHWQKKPSSKPPRPKSTATSRSPVSGVIGQRGAAQVTSDGDAFSPDEGVALSS